MKKDEVEVSEDVEELFNKITTKEEDRWG